MLSEDIMMETSQSQDITLGSYLSASYCMHVLIKWRNTLFTVAAGEIQLVLVFTSLTIVSSKGLVRDILTRSPFVFITTTVKIFFVIFLVPLNLQLSSQGSSESSSSSLAYMLKQMNLILRHTLQDML